MKTKTENTAVEVMRKEEEMVEETNFNAEAQEY